MQQAQRSSEAPQSVEAEAKIIGSILVNPAVLPRIARTLQYRHFHDPRHMLIFRSMQQLVVNGSHISPVTVSDFLQQQNMSDKAGGSAYLMELMSGIATTEPTEIEQYCRIIAERYLQRSLINFGQELIEYGATTDDPHELIKLSTETLARMNGSVGGGDQRIMQSVIKGSDLFRKEIAKPQSIIGEGVMTESSFVLLYGKPGLGKTWLALQMALAIAGGKPWLGMQTQQRRVGIVELEMHEYYLQQRLVELASHMDAEEAQTALANIEFLVRPSYQGTVDLMENATRDGIISWVQGNGIGVLILDALSRCHFAAENDAQEMGRVLGSIERIRDETQAGITGIHHEPKEVKDANLSDLDAARGSSRFQSDPHTMMRLKVWKGRPVLAFAKMNLGSLLEPIYLERKPQGHYTVTAAPDAPELIRERNTMKVEQILLRSGQGGATNQMVAEELGLSPRTVKKYLDEVGVRVKGVYYHKSLVKTQLAIPTPRYTPPSADDADDDDDVSAAPNSPDAPETLTDTHTLTPEETETGAQVDPEPPLEPFFPTSADPA